MQIVYNWHITERCNYSCKFCFSKWERPYEIWKDEAAVEKLLTMISRSGQAEVFRAITSSSGDLQPRINFVGGEPLILGEKLDSYIKIAKSLGIGTSMITNASLLMKHIMVVKHLDLIGISIDSLSHDTNLAIGRCDSSRRTMSEECLINLVSQIREINELIDIKFNIVVNEHNWEQCLVSRLLLLNPAKIKIFKQLPFGKERGISDTQFNHFLMRNETEHESIFIEGNEDMRNSYLMIDPMGRFFQNSTAKEYTFSKPIQDVGILAAIMGMKFDSNKYLNRYRIGA